MIFNVMDKTGHSEEVYSTADKLSLEAAMARFEELTKKKGYIANVPGVNGGPSTHLKAFDPNVETIDFHPQLIGG